MDFNEYQKKAFETAMSFSRETLFYNALGLAGEVGEVVELVKKLYRDEFESPNSLCVFDREYDEFYPSRERTDKIKKELGDVLWYLSAIASVLNLRLSDIATANLAKLEDRKSRNTLGGDGDDR